MTVNKLEQLLERVRSIIAHHEQMEEIRGEKFNVFSILGMETKENATHSAFLRELLDPKGSHLKRTKFMELFLERYGKNEIDVSSAKVEVEHHIGTKTIDEKFEDATGGRMDIYISDKNNRTICIENKIHASEQEKQIERYCNYNRGKNTVYYLTLNGDKPESAGKFEQDKDYYLLSYRDDIVNWLQLCMKESYDSPILRETIKQYILLINKLTNTMDSNGQKELFNLILKNHEEAKIIAENYEQAVGPVLDCFRNDLKEQLSTQLTDKYNLYLGKEDVTNKYSNLWIKIKGKNEVKFFFGISSFSIGNNITLRLGILSVNGYEDCLKIFKKDSNWWYSVEEFKPFIYNGTEYSVMLNESSVIKMIKFNAEFRVKLLEHIVNETLAYLEIYHDKVDRCLEPLPKPE